MLDLHIHLELLHNFPWAQSPLGSEYASFLIWTTWRASDWSLSFFHANQPTHPFFLLVTKIEFLNNKLYIVTLLFNILVPSRLFTLTIKSYTHDCFPACSLSTFPGLGSVLRVFQTPLSSRLCMCFLCVLVFLSETFPPLPIFPFLTSPHSTRCH